MTIIIEGIKIIIEIIKGIKKAKINNMKFITILPMKFITVFILNTYYSYLYFYYKTFNIKSQQLFYKKVIFFQEYFFYKFDTVYNQFL